MTLLPPSTGSWMPVIKLASLLARNAIAFATSSGCPWRPSGWVVLQCSRNYKIQDICHWTGIFRKHGCRSSQPEELVWVGRQGAYLVVQDVIIPSRLPMYISFYNPRAKNQTKSILLGSKAHRHAAQYRCTYLTLLTLTPFGARSRAVHLVNWSMADNDIE